MGNNSFSEVSFSIKIGWNRSVRRDDEYVLKASYIIPSKQRGDGRKFYSNLLSITRHERNSTSISALKLSE